MTRKTVSKTTSARKTGIPVRRKPKTQLEVKKELREQQALDTDKSKVEDYITPSSRHFGF